jgi:hypothetical protein
MAIMGISASGRGNGCEYKRGALVEAWETGEHREYYGRVFRLYITANGRALYHDQWTRYRELYPDIDAPEPAPATDLRAASEWALAHGCQA